MASQDLVTVGTYADDADAVAAEILLYESGFSTDEVRRSGGELQVATARVDEARRLLAAMSPDAAISADDAAIASGAAGGTASAVTDVVGDATSTTVDAVQSAASSTVGAVGGAASSVVDTAQDVVSTTTDAVQNVASVAVDTAQQAAGAVADKVQDVTEVVTGAVSEAASTAADSVEGLADNVEQVAASPGAPAAQRVAAETATTVLDKTAEYLRAGDMNVMLDDLRGVIRRNPGWSLLVGFGLGYLARGSVFGSSTSAPTPQSTRPQSQGQAVPVYAGEGGFGYDAAISTPVVPPMPSTDFGSDVPGTMAGAMAGDLDLETSTGHVAPMATDDDVLAEELLYGTDAAAGDDIVGVDDMRSADSDLLSSVPGDLGLGDADLGGAGGLDLSGNLGSIDSMGAGPDDVGSIDDTTQESTGDDAGMDDQLRRWDARTRGEEI